MKVIIDLDPKGEESRLIRFRGGSGLHDNEHTRAVFDAADALTEAVRRCQGAEHKGGMHKVRVLR